MQFGIFYEHQIPRPWADGDEHRLFKDALEQVEIADRIGIEYVWEVEHHFLEGFRFFGYALSHFYRHGIHISGEFDIWADFQKNAPERKKHAGCIGSPDQVRAHLEQLERINGQTIAQSFTGKITPKA